MTFIRSLSVLASALGLIAATAVAAPAIGRTASTNDALNITQARVSLGEAVRLAEQGARGKATRAEYENTPRGGVYAIEVVRGTDVLDVTVNATKGTITSTVADRVDRDSRRSDAQDLNAREPDAKE